MDLDFFMTMARYNRWANKRIYGACQQLSEEEYRKQRDGVFLSIHRTLNHVLLVDRIWMNRIRGKKLKVTTLRKELYSDRAALRIARKMKDSKISRLITKVKKRHMEGAVRYEDRDGVPHATPLPYVLAHMFNHQAHHRGQVHNMLSQTDVPPPSIDLIDFIRIEEKKKARKAKKAKKGARP